MFAKACMYGPTKKIARGGFRKKVEKQDCCLNKRCMDS